MENRLYRDIKRLCVPGSNVIVGLIGKGHIPVDIVMMIEGKSIMKGSASDSYEGTTPDGDTVYFTTSDILSIRTK